MPFAARSDPCGAAGGAVCTPAETNRATGVIFLAADVQTPPEHGVNAPAGPLEAAVGACLVRCAFICPLKKHSEKAT